MKSAVFFVLIGLIIFGSGQLAAQGLPAPASKSYLRNANAQNYLSPFVDLVGASLHSMHFSYHHPDSNKKFHLHLGVSVAASIVTDQMKTFTGVTEAPFTPEARVEVPTIFGKNESLTAYDKNGTGYSFPGGFGINQVNLLIPQLQVGTLFHTNFNGKFVALDVGGELKRIEMYGFGINHFISDYWHAQKYFVSVGGQFDAFNLGDYLEGKNWLAQASVGRQVKRFNCWSYLQYQKASYDFHYADDEQGDGFVTVKGKNNVRFGIGGSVRLAFIKIQAEASILHPIMANLGLGIQF